MQNEPPRQPSTVIRTPSHSVLRNLLEVVTHEQARCPYVRLLQWSFLVSWLRINGGGSKTYLRHWEKVLPCKKEHISMWVTARTNINPSGKNRMFLRGSIH